MSVILDEPDIDVRFSETDWSALHGVALEPGVVHVYAARIGGGVEPNDALLSDAELERARSFVRDSDRRNFIESRAFLRRILAGHAAAAPAEIQFEHGPWGKPRLSGSPGSRSLEFSLSHSRGVVLVGLAMDQAIGIDVELMRRLDDYDKLAQRFFAPGEYRDLCALPEPARLRGFFRYWTRKEAVVKALGTGMRTPFDSFAVTLTATVQRIDLRMSAPCASEWSLHQLEPCEGAIGALAAPFRVRRIEARLIA